MAWTLVQSNKKSDTTGGANTATITLASTPTANNLLIAAITVSGGQKPTAADTQSNSWSTLCSTSYGLGPTVSLVYLYCIAKGGGGAYTLTWTGTAFAYDYMLIGEWSGNATTGVLDTNASSNTGNAGNVTSLAVGPGTSGTANAGSLAVGICALRDGSGAAQTSWTPPSGFTDIQQILSAASPSAGIELCTQTITNAGTNVSGTWTIAGDNGPMDGAFGVFVPLASATFIAPPNLIVRQAVKRASFY